MGSWLGRLAARYQMEVMQFGHINDLALPTPDPSVGWLLMPPLQQASIGRLSHLARVASERIERMQTPPHWITARTALRYCSTCLFLNPRDVTAPRWIRNWLDPEASSECPFHSKPLTSVSTFALRGCKHFGAVLKLISDEEHIAEAYARQRTLAELMHG
jgi:hypothetical protein